MDDLIECPLCGHKAKSLVTHFKRTHNTNALGIDKMLNLVPGTTKNCSNALRRSFSNSGGKKVDATKQTRREIEDDIMSDDMFI